VIQQRRCIDVAVMSVAVMSMMSDVICNAIRSDGGCSVGDVKE
jgi:hypothetical protein